jgi:hypothetical protein
VFDGKISSCQLGGVSDFGKITIAIANVKQIAAEMK